MAKDFLRLCESHKLTQIEDAENDGKKVNKRLRDTKFGL